MAAYNKPEGRGWRLGLTGGIGSGKSTVRNLFEAAGWQTLDADSIVRDLLNKDPEVQAALRKQLGDAAILPDGTANRPWIGQRVFKDPTQLTWLEQLLHPRVRHVWQSALEQVPEQPWLVEIPLLFEKKLESSFDLTVAVIVGEGTQLQRLAHRGIEELEARRRIRLQLPSHEKQKRADFVLSNDGTPEFLHQQVHSLITTLETSA